MWAIDADRVASEAGWAAGSTPSCSRASSPSPASCPARRRSATSRRRSRRPTASAARHVVERNFAAIDAALAALHRVEVPAAATATGHRRADRARRRARLRQAGHGPADGRRRRPAAGQRPARRRHVPDRHGPVREAGASPRRSRSGTPTSASTAASARSSARTPTIRMKVFEPPRPWTAPRRRSSPRSSAPRTCPGYQLTIQVAPDDCTGCGVCVDVCPAKSKTEVTPQGDQHGAGR